MAMDEIVHLLAAAWKRIRPRLLADPAELHRRLARRDTPLLTRPPRAWCLCIRANDTRLDALRTSRQSPINNHQPHEICLISDDLRRLTAPVHIDWPGEPLLDVAKKLGVTQSSLVASRLNGTFRVRWIEGLNGHFAKPHPILCCDEPLDPSTRGFLMPDPIWWKTAALLRKHLPRNIRAVMKRVPIFRDQTRPFRDKSNLHPEHPDVDRGVGKRRNRRLPPYPGDIMAWYKWKDGVFVGHDWRNPLAAENYARRQREKVLRHEGYVKRRLAKPPASAGGGSAKFMGWNFVCPRCNKQVKTLLLPLPRVHLLPGKLRHPAIDGRRDCLTPGPRSAARDSSSSPTVASSLRRSVASPTFACERCHNVRRVSRVEPGTWNVIVSYLSGGLLYGHEVPRPAWFKRQRKRTYAPRPTRAPSQTRARVLSLLLAGFRLAEIAETLHLTKRSLGQVVHKLYKEHGAHSLKELLLRHGQPAAPPAPKKRATRSSSG
jgi:hypothetical protein